MGALQFKASPSGVGHRRMLWSYGPEQISGLTPEKLAYAVDMGLLAMVQLSMRYVETMLLWQS